MTDAPMIGSPDAASVTTPETVRRCCAWSEVVSRSAASVASTVAAGRFSFDTNKKSKFFIHQLVILG